ncbi:methyl-accepting chemotaxis protein [Pseudoalteromonas fenneropenaei]|uniref:Methyl-accepting chemotaxis protein n=1 Tax=Pseudoalteromonas fenneropenaei TaxID=1737459 RepID=A0ABV7CK54_9GAMM
MGFLENLTIKRRLQLNALFVGVAMVVMLVVIIYEAKTMLRLNETIQYAEELDIHELAMRKYEKNFLFYKDVSALVEFDNEYQQLNDKIAKLQAIFADFALDKQQLSQFSSLAKIYYDEFQHVVKLQKRIGLDPKDGLYGELRAAVHEVETLLKEKQSSELLVMMLQLRRTEKDFMLRLDAKYQSTFNGLIVTFKDEIQRSGLEAEYVQPLLSLVNVYQDKFNTLVDAQVELGVSLDTGALGRMKKAVEASDQVVSQIVEQTKLQIVTNASQTQTFAIGIFIVSAIVVMILVLSTSRSIVEPVERVYQTIEQIRRENDLSLSIEQSGNDEISHMTADFNSLIGDFRTLIAEVNSALSTVNHATQSLTESSSQTSAGMQEQLHEADMVATAATEMQATIQDISHNTEAAAHKAESTNGNAQQGRKEVDATIKLIMHLSSSLGGASNVVSQLEKDAVTIGSVLDVIRGIAEQTNLLALNAAIEAARAGEQGRGFAVVADEVRSLAQRTQDSTKEIETIISSLQLRTREVVSIMEQCRAQGSDSVAQAEKAGKLLEMITNDVQTIMDMSTHIATAIDEQNQVASEVNKNVVRIRDIAQVATDHAYANAQSTEEVAEQAKVLHQAVARYRV